MMTNSVSIAANVDDWMVLKWNFGMKMIERQGEFQDKPIFTAELYNFQGKVVLLRFFEFGKSFKQYFR